MVKYISEKNLENIVLINTKSGLFPLLNSLCVTMKLYIFKTTHQIRANNKSPLDRTALPNQ